MKNEYTQEIAEAIKLYLESIDVCYKFDEKEGKFEFIAELKSKVKKLYFTIAVENGAYFIFSDFDLTIADESIADVSIYLHRINFFASYFSYFSLDFDKRKICCQSHTNCADITPTYETIEESIFSVLELVERYGDILVDVAEGKEPPKEVLEKLIEEELEKEY